VQIFTPHPKILGNCAIKMEFHGNFTPLWFESTWHEFFELFAFDSTKNYNATSEVAKNVSVFAKNVYVFAKRC
jgi:hypothetical protein